jgi:hypothetical protein
MVGDAVHTDHGDSGHMVVWWGWRIVGRSSLNLLLSEIGHGKIPPDGDIGGKSH